MRRHLDCMVHPKATGHVVLKYVVSNKSFAKRQPSTLFPERFDYPKVNGSSDVFFNDNDYSGVNIKMIGMDPVHSETVPGWKFRGSQLRSSPVQSYRDSHDISGLYVLLITLSL